MANNKTAEVLLRFKVDNASVNQVRASFNQLDMQLDDLRSELTGMGTSAQQGVTNLRQRFAQGETAIESMQGEVEQLRRDLLALDNVTVTPTVDVQNGSGISVKGNSALNTVDRFGRFGTQISGAFGQAGGIGNAIGLIGDVADSFGTLGVVGGGAALAVGGVSLALAEMKRIADEAAAAQQRLIEGERAGEAQATQTVQDRVARIKEIIGLVAQEEQSINERRQEIADLNERLQNATGLNGDLIAQFRAGTEFSGQIRALEESITNSENTLAGLSAEFIELNTQVQPAVQGMGQISAVLGAIAPTAENVVQRITGMATGLHGLFAVADGLAPVLDLVGQGLADVREKASAAWDQLRSDKADSYLNAITQTVQAQEALTKAQNAYNEAVTASAQRISDINAKLQSDLTAAETDRQTDLADAAREAGDQRVKITEDAEKERARIQKRFDRSYSDAVGDRDALAAKRAEEQRDDEIDQLDERYRDQLVAIDKSLAAQQKVIQSRYEAQVKTVRAAADASIRLETQRAQAELSIKQQAITAAQTQMINAANAELMIRSNLYNQSVNQATVWANTMQFLISYGLSIPAGAGTGGGIGGRTLPTPLASGGPMTAGQSYWVGEQGPELVTPTRPGYVNPAGTGFNINLNLSGATTETIRAVSRQQALATFGRVLDQMGVA